ncbi:hypothetical protein N7471_010435 [Penicillium samsonianum]|uniref:uncharacterized protein n=1 Tax=Penicillium samsonianum TaxID=1882272 RepID=UPI002548DAE8|nr:uncharacterized protein N7471_010435 [Penicillium samsonianum]KAJ6125942.1 hypothetical protein N7471_010435 [Penicillium samsonianum]
MQSSTPERLNREKSYFLLKMREKIVRLRCPPGLKSRFEVCGVMTEFMTGVSFEKLKIKTRPDEPPIAIFEGYPGAVIIQAIPCLMWQGSRTVKGGLHRDNIFKIECASTSMQMIQIDFIKLNTLRRISSKG